MEVYEAKVVVVGNCGVGKTNIATKFVNNKFVPSSNSTIGATYLSRDLTLGKKKVKFSIWDTAGQERYQALAKLYYRNADFILLVYDITSKESFDQLQQWYEEVDQKAPENPFVVVVGNKSDLKNEAVLPSEAIEYAEKIEASWTTTSAKTGQGIEELFVKLAKEHNPRRLASTMSESVILNCMLKPPKRRCC